MLSKLRLGLAERSKKTISDPNLTPSAVILPLLIKNGICNILFIKRAETVTVHKGQISFPGGHVEATDVTILNTALRETYEEIGVPQEKIEIIGDLDDCETTISKHVISIFIGLVPYPYNFKLDSREVADIMIVPISTLLDKKYQSENPSLFRGLPGGPAYRHNNQVIWGATARILTQ